MMKQARLRQLFSIFLLALLLISCSDKKPSLNPLSSDAVILAFGDSLTYGIGANSKTESYPAILSQLTGLQVINEGISGEISQHGLERLPDVLQTYKPQLVILCHGGNDIIRKLGKVQLKNNLDRMIALIKNTGAEVVLIGVPNFNLMLSVPDLYQELALKHTSPIELELLPEIERNPKMKSDQIHPNGQGYNLMAERMHELLQYSGAL